MKVLVNALGTRRGGSEVFVTSLLPKLSQLDKAIIYTVLVPATRAFTYSDLPQNVHLLHVNEANFTSFRKRLALEHRFVPQLMRSEKFDWLLQADDMLSPFTPFVTKSLVVFHASIQFIFPDQLGDSLARVMYWRFIKHLSLKRATVPVTVSFCAKGELSRGDRKVFEKLQVVYHGIDRTKFTSVNKNPKPEFPPDLPTKYILSVSTRNPHKNYYRLVKAYNLLVKTTPISEHLLIVGSPVSSEEESRIRDYIEVNNLSERVHLREHIEHRYLPELYRRASVYAYTSLYDSFGFTPLEAMACGTPCAVSFMSAMPEICGDAAEYFNPLCEESIAAALRITLLDEERRDELVTYGIARAKRYTWASTAKRYYELLTSNAPLRWSV